MNTVISRRKFSRASEEAAFQQHITDNPEDLQTPLVYADWLEENGKPAHAELLRQHASEIPKYNDPENRRMSTYANSRGVPHGVRVAYASVPSKHNDTHRDMLVVRYPFQNGRTLHMSGWFHRTDARRLLNGLIQEGATRYNDPTNEQQEQHNRNFDSDPPESPGQLSRRKFAKLHPTTLDAFVGENAHGDMLNPNDATDGALADALEEGNDPRYMILRQDIAHRRGIRSEAEGGFRGFWDRFWRHAKKIGYTFPKNSTERRTETRHDLGDGTTLFVRQIHNPEDGSSIYHHQWDAKRAAYDAVFTPEEHQRIMSGLGLSEEPQPEEDEGPDGPSGGGGNWTGDPNEDRARPLSRRRFRRDLIPGGKGDKVSEKDVDPEQLAMGIKVESEHTSNPKLAKEIALDHLTEDSQYYTKLHKMEHPKKARRRFAAYRAPAGGMVVRGTAYKGGEMVPDMKGKFMNPPKKKAPPKFDPAKLAAVRSKFKVKKMPPAVANMDGTSGPAPMPRRRKFAKGLTSTPYLTMMSSTPESLGRLSRRTVMKYSALTTEADFHRKIEENPQETTSHLVYADWLDENGRPGLASLIRRTGGKGFIHDAEIPSRPPRILSQPEGELEYGPNPKWDHLLSVHFPTNTGTKKRLVYGANFKPKERKQAEAMATALEKEGFKIERKG